MKKIILFGCIFVCSILLVTPSIPAIQFNIVEEKSESEFQILNNIKIAINQIKLYFLQLVEKIKENENPKVFLYQRFVNYFENSINNLEKFDNIFNKIEISLACIFFFVKQ